LQWRMKFYCSWSNIPHRQEMLYTNFKTGFMNLIG
jgi:hypothetical protein